ncbi:Ig-like domain-containing protein [Ethanoligenens sp.]|uniref:Ig-like domain-containing protein n=1 Tax=Ethanoligenens sp. TaxID=2099655 RepID=UPI0039EBB773
MKKQTTDKSKVKETRAKRLIVTVAAILAVTTSSVGIVYAQAAPIQPIITAAGVQRLQSVSGGITDIDTPTAGTSASGKVNITGWALNAAGIDRVDIYAWDASGHAHGLGSVPGSALAARQDVENALPGFDTLNSGYSLSVDTTKLPAGQYTIAVAGIGKDGSVNWASTPISIGPAPLTDIDTPTGEQDGAFTVAGWALNHDGINRVDVYALDGAGHYHGLGSVDGSKLAARLDVANALPAFNTLNSGYSLNVPAGTLPNGGYTLCVAGIGNDGDVKWQTTNISVGQMKPLTDIDAPTSGMRVTNGQLAISGWALNAAGIDRVDIYALDSAGKYHGLGSVTGSALTARQDVKNVFPSFKTLNSGYSLTADVSTLAPGSYTLCVAGIGTDNSVQWATSQFNVVGATSAPPITDLDTPSTTYTGAIPVTGWALNSSGINRVDIYAYPAGSSKALDLGSVPSSALIARQDVENKFPAYGTLNSGYSLTVPAGTLVPGNYTLAVAGIGNDGSVAWATRGIAVQKVANYQGVNETRAFTDEITGIQQTVQFLGVGAGYYEVAAGNASVVTTSALGSAHSGLATATITGTNGINQSSGTAVTKDGSDGGTFTFSNLTVGTYTIQLTANDGTVVAKYSFTVDSLGNVN